MNGHIVHRLEPPPEPSADLSPPTSATSDRASMSRWVGAQPRWLFSLSGLRVACGRGSADLRRAGAACRLDRGAEVLIMVTHARYAALVAVRRDGAAACAGGGAGGRERPAARGGCGPRRAGGCAACRQGRAAAGAGGTSGGT